MDLLTFIGITFPGAIALVLGAYSQYRISLNNKEIEVQGGVIAALEKKIKINEETIAVQDRTIDALQVEIEETNRKLDEEKRLRAVAEQTIKELNLRIAELEGIDKRRRRGMGQFEDRGLG